MGLFIFLFVMKASVVFLFACLFLACFADDDQDITVYVNVDGGDDTSSDCDASSPCATLAGAFGVVGNDTVSITVKMSPGVYTGAGNIGVTIPPVSVLIDVADDSDDSEPVTFNCASSATTLFVIEGASGKNFHLKDIEITNCTAAISFAPTDPEQTLTVGDVTFDQVSYPITFAGGALQIDDTNFMNAVTAVKVTNATSIYIDGSTFQDGS